MNPEYNRVNAPVLRGPLLFHQAPVQPVSAYYPTQSSSVPTKPRLYFPNTTQYTLQPRYPVQTSLPAYSYSYPYYSAFPLATATSQIPISTNSIPNLTYAPTVSSKGLTLILIATLILVALDLMIVRPQKLNMLEVRDLKSEVSYVSY